MTIPTEVIMRMATIGLSEDQARAVADMLTAVETATAAASEEGKEKARARWRKWKAANADKRLPTTANVSKRLVGGDAPVEDKTSTLEIEPQKKENIEDAFAGVLSPELAHEVVVHRKAMKKPITAFGAKLLAKQIASCPDPTFAAETMIASGWQSVKPEYMRPNQRGSPKARTAVDVAEDLLREMETVNADPTAKIEGHSAPPLRLSDYRHG